MVYWSFQYPVGIYQVPFFVAIGFIAFIVPQLIGLYLNPAPLTLDIIDKFSLMSIFCVLACWISYIKVKINHQYLLKINKKYNYSLSKLFEWGIIYTIVGNFFFLLIGNLDDSDISTQATGIFTVFIFFGRLIYPGFVLLLIPTLSKPLFVRVMICLCATLQPLTRFLIFGRRSELLIFICIILLSLFFIKKIVIPKQFLLIGIMLGFVFGISVGQYRNIVTDYNLTFLDLLSNQAIARITEGLTSVNWIDGITQSFSGEKSSEVKFAASAMEAIESDGGYGLGRGYWNKLIFSYIPAQFVGKELKESFYLLSPNVINLIQARFGFQTFRTGLTITCVGELFVEFWFFGSFIFCIISYFYKHLWTLANEYDDLIVQVFYCLMLPFCVVAIGSATSNLLSQVVYNYAAMIPVVLYSRFDKKVVYFL